MTPTTNRTPSQIRNFVLTLTVGATLCGLFIPEVWVQGHILFFALVLILGGIPHGASDYLVFNELLRKRLPDGRTLKFIIFYLAITVSYGFLWYFIPMAAFGLFILISLYHFGQSNWQYVRFRTRAGEALTFILWGALVVCLPILLYHQESGLIILEITGHELNMESIRWPAIYLIILANLVNVVHLFDADLIQAKGLNRELVNILVLTGLFATTPLLIGFGIYFLFWHSLGSTIDQIKLFRKLNIHFSGSDYLWKMAPLTLGAFVFLGILYLWLGHSMNQGLNLGVLFLFISLITVPHSILMDRFYLVQEETTINPDP